MWYLHPTLLCTCNGVTGVPKFVNHEEFRVSDSQAREHRGHDSIYPPAHRSGEKRAQWSLNHTAPHLQKDRNTRQHVRKRRSDRFPRAERPISAAGGTRCTFLSRTLVCIKEARSRSGPTGMVERGSASANQNRISAVFSFISSPL